MIEDFISSSAEDKMHERRKLLSFLQIDCLLRRAELYKQAPDYKSAIEDLLLVEKMCKEFPEKNEPTMISAIFQKGTCYLDLKEREQAKECFNTVQVL